MMRYVVLDKEVGQTPLSAILSFKESNPAYKDIPMTYAGRLDPMASGKLLILIGDECKKQETYHALDKQYQFTILFGFSTETGDVLGLPTSCPPPPEEGIEQKIQTVLEDLPKELSLPYPVYSSKTVAGKPLFLWALEKRLDEIAIPHFTSKLYGIELREIEHVSARDVSNHIHQKIDTIPEVTEESKKLGADFRRKEIHTAWHEVFPPHDENQYAVAHFTCNVSSGMYIRSLAPCIAKQMGTCGLAYSIYRSKIGRYTNTPLGGFWTKVFK